jgi:hypothetical protein
VLGKATGHPWRRPSKHIVENDEQSRQYVPKTRQEVFASPGTLRICLERQKDILGDKHPSTLNTMDNLGVLKKILVKVEQKPAALKREKLWEEAQLASGAMVVTRLIGFPGDVEHDTLEKIFDSFATAGVPDLYSNLGVVVYYETEVLKGSEGLIPQFGFALRDGLDPSDELSEDDGVGDNKASWAVDGVRLCKWHGGEAIPQSCSWAAGNTMGLAANVDTGTMAISKDGNWATDGFGVVFRDDTIKEGVYPCFTAEGGYTIRYRLTHDDFKHTPPPDSIGKIAGGHLIRQNFYDEPSKNNVSATSHNSGNRMSCYKQHQQEMLHLSFILVERTAKLSSPIRVRVIIMRLLRDCWGMTK